MIHRRIGKAVLLTNVKGPFHFVDVEIGQADFPYDAHAH